MTATLAEPALRLRRTGVDFIEEAACAAAICRANAETALRAALELERTGDQALGARPKWQAARRLRQQAATHERDARCHEEAVLVMVSLADELRR